MAKPFLQDVLFIWLDAWSVKPLPALVKFGLSVVVIAIMLLPIVYALCGTLLYLGFWQHQIDRLAFHDSLLQILFQRFIHFQFISLCISHENAVILLDAADIETDGILGCTSGVLSAKNSRLSVDHCWDDGLYEIVAGNGIVNKLYMTIFT